MPQDRILPLVITPHFLVGGSDHLHLPPVKFTVIARDPYNELRRAPDGTLYTVRLQPLPLMAKAKPRKTNR
jgi:hypothetical protein